MEKVDRAIENKMMTYGIMGTEMVTVEINLTPEEKEEFLNCEKYNSRNYSWEFEGNTLIISYQEETEVKISDLEKRFGGKLLTEEEFEELEFHEDVDHIENNGISGADPSKTWYTCYLMDGTEFDFYG